MTPIKTWQLLDGSAFTATDYARLRKWSIDIQIHHDMIEYNVQGNAVKIPSRHIIKLKTNNPRHETLLKLLYGDKIQLIEERYDDNWNNSSIF